MPEARLARTRAAYSNGPKWRPWHENASERLYRAFKNTQAWRVVDASAAPRRFGLAQGEEEYRDGVLVRRGELKRRAFVADRDFGDETDT